MFLRKVFVGGKKAGQASHGDRIRVAVQHLGGALLQKNKRRAKQTRTSGQELVEFAIVLPLLLLIAFGVLDLGRGFHAVISITNVAREGARFGVDYNWNDSSVPNPQSGYAAIESVSLLEAQNSHLDPSKMNVNPLLNTCDGDPCIVVEVTYDFELIMGILPDFTMERSAKMMIP